MYTFEDLKQIMKTLRAEDGCPWDRAQDHDTLKKHLVEECAEVLEAIDAHDTENLCEELGDVLFSAVNIARFLKVDAEDSLNASTEKFINRFCKVEQLAQKQGIDLEKASVEQMEQLWKQAKNQ